MFRGESWRVRGRLHLVTTVQCAGVKTALLNEETND